MTNGSPEAAMASMEKLTAEWASDSPNGCSEWLRTLPAGPAQEGALFAFVEEVMQHDPESAFLWTRRFDLPTRREVRAKAVWERWVSTASVSAARFSAQFDEHERAWLNLPLPP
jgi:diadenosine tetraphosphatase ApaH/serine/threonine PP2A family protein phosphatase